jgi:hypothetical protein
MGDTGRSAEIDAEPVALDFFGDIGDHCGRKSSTTSGFEYSERLSPLSPRGAGGGAR